MSEIDDHLIFENTAIRSIYKNYEAKLGKYEPLIQIYNNAITTNRQKYASIPEGQEMFAFLIAPEFVPPRPCPPDQPPAYWGLKLDFTKTWGAGGSSLTQQERESQLSQYRNYPNKSLDDESMIAVEPTSSVLKSVRTGFLQASTDIALFTSAQIQNVGHVFGRLGQGERTMPNYLAQFAFQWSNPTPNDHGMMISILPVVPTDTTGLTAGKTIDFVVKSV